MGKRRYRRRRPGRRLLAWLCVIVVVAAFLCSQQRCLQRETLTVSCPGLPQSFDGFRITVVADLHGTEFGARSTRLLRAVRAARPDLIAVPGDLIDAPEQLAMVPAVALGLEGIAPTYYVTGNHEWAIRAVPELTKTLEACGVEVLENNYRILHRGGEIVLLAGLHDPLGPAGQKTDRELYREITAQWPGEYTLLLFHRNDRLDRLADCGYDLVLCGHAHGGVIRLPKVGGLIDTDRSLFPAYTDGLYTEDGTQMVVGRGLGNTPHSLRLFNRPQVLTLVLQAA